VGRHLPPWQGIVAALAGTAVGIATAQWATGERAMQRVPSNPSWGVDALAGAGEAGLHTRARIARIGLLALGRDEAVYYIADRDADGQPLREACTYSVSGGDVPGRWWSLTVYADDRFLAGNEDAAHSLGAEGMPVDAAGQWHVRLAPERGAEAMPWLSTRNTRAPTLALRIYRPSPALRADPVRVVLPRIGRLRCGEPA
jgi:hypothetical protein